MQSPWKGDSRNVVETWRGCEHKKELSSRTEAYQEHAKEVDRALVELWSKMSEQEKMLGKGERQVRQTREDMNSLRGRPVETGGSTSSTPKRDEQNKKDMTSTPASSLGPDADGHYGGCEGGH